MASYATLSFGSLELWSTRDDFGSELALIFRPSDKHTEQIGQRDRQRLEKYVDDDFADEYDEGNPFTVVEYRCTAAVARDRLDLQGFTYEVAEAHFERELEASIRHSEEFIREGRYPNLTDVLEERIRIMRTLTTSKWRQGLVRIKEEGLTRDSLDGLPSTDNQLPLLRYMLGRGMGSYGFPGYDDRHFVRIVLETAAPQESLVYDFSGLISNVWEDDVDEFVGVAESIMEEDFLLGKRVIVLTEGDRDREFLERSLRLLYPHLVDYFHFFDFTGQEPWWWCWTARQSRSSVCRC